MRRTLLLVVLAGVIPVLSGCSWLQPTPEQADAHSKELAGISGKLDGISTVVGGIGKVIPPAAPFTGTISLILGALSTITATFAGVYAKKAHSAASEEETPAPPKT